MRDPLAKKVWKFPVSMSLFEVEGLRFRNPV